MSLKVKVKVCQVEKRDILDFRIGRLVCIHSVVTYVMTSRHEASDIMGQEY